MPSPPTSHRAAAAILRSPMRSSVISFITAVSIVPTCAASEIEWSFTVVEHASPTEMVAGTLTQVPLVLRNDGVESWAAGDDIAVSYHWLDSEGHPVQWDGVRTPLPSPVAGSDTVQLVADILAPDSPGEYLLQWDVVQEGVRWLSETDTSPPPTIRITVRVGHAMTVTGGESLRWLGPGEEVVLRVGIRNDGSLTWQEDGSFALSYHWYDRDGGVVVWDGRRSRLPVRVAPGESSTVQATVQAPQRSGWYRLQWDLVHEGVTWFSQRDESPEPRLTVLVFAPLVVTPAMWAAVTTLVVLLSLAVYRSKRHGLMADLVAVADLAWLAGVLVVSQRSVLVEAGQTPSFTGGLLVFTGVAALLLPLLAVPTRVRPWVSWAVGAFGVFVVFADLLYQRFFGDILSMAALLSARQLGRVGASIWDLTLVSDLWLWAQLLPGGALAWVVTRVCATTERPRRRAIAVGLLVLICAGVAIGAGVVRSESGVAKQVFRNVYLARDIGVVNFHVYDLARHLTRRLATPAVSDEEIDDLVAWFWERAPTRAGVGQWFGAARGANLLMIQAESLQGFVIGLEVHGQQVTPFLNRWADRSLLFTNVTDQTAQGRSSDSELVTQVSLLPPSRGAAAFLYPMNRFTGLAGVLQEHGYHTLSAVPFDGGFWNRQLTHPAYGYRESQFAVDFNAGESIGWGLNDRAFLGQMVPRLVDLEQPFCVWLLTLSLHHPFSDFPEHHKVLDVAGWEGTAFGNYLHTINFFDRALEELIVGLEVAGLADHTVVALWGDHDAGLDWQPELARIAGRRHDAAGWYLSQRVPLMIRIPGEGELIGERILAAGHQDVAPTLLALLGIDASVYAFVGRNLLGDPGDLPVVGEYQCWQDSKYLFLQGGPDLIDGECYELATLEPVDIAMCADGYRDGLRQVEVSRSVLEHDLQWRIHQRLSGRTASPAP